MRTTLGERVAARWYHPNGKLAIYIPDNEDKRRKLALLIDDEMRQRNKRRKSAK